jgi:hypothetical protein
VSGGTESSYRCGLAARWLPRTLAASVLVAGLLVAGRVDTDLGVPGARTLRGLLAVGAAVAALWILRKGGEVRLRVTAGAEGLAFERRKQSLSLAFDDIDGIRYEAPFGPSRFWLPAAVLVDRHGREWRLSALLRSGGRLVDEIVERSGREGLGTWATEHRVVKRMSRATFHVRVGYAVALAILLAAVLHFLY